MIGTEDCHLSVFKPLTTPLCYHHTVFYISWCERKKASHLTVSYRWDRRQGKRTNHNKDFRCKPKNRGGEPEGGQAAVIWEVTEVRAVHLSCPCSGADSQSKTNSLNTEARCRSSPSSPYHTTALTITAAKTTSSRRKGGRAWQTAFSVYQDNRCFLTVTNVGQKLGTHICGLKIQETVKF